MELISKLNYDICKIIENYSNIIFEFKFNDVSQSFYYGDNKNYITFYKPNHIVFVKYKETIVTYLYEYIFKNNDTLRRNIITSYNFKLKAEVFDKKDEFSFFYSYSIDGVSNIINFKEFFRKIDNVNWDLVGASSFINNSGSHPLPEFIDKKDLKKICIDFLFNENYNFSK